MSFRDAVTGWAAGRCVGPAPSPYFYVTHDGGTTWQAQPLAGLPPTLACPCDVGSTVPVFSSSRDAMMTVSVDTEHTSCQPQNGGTACGTESIPGIAIVYLTHDGGITWAPHVLPGVAAGADPTFIDARTGWYGASVLQAAPSYLGETTFDKLYVTHDGGSSWNATGTGSGFSGGPMQFNVTNRPISTWQRVADSYIYGARPGSYDHKTRLHPSLYDDFDSIMAAAHLLSVDGAAFALEGAAWNAAYDYYGHDATGVTYADQVLARAISWSQRGFCINCGVDQEMVLAVHAAYGAPVLAALTAEEAARRAAATRPTRASKRSRSAPRRSAPAPAPRG